MYLSSTKNWKPTFFQSPHIFFKNRNDGNDDGTDTIQNALYHNPPIEDKLNVIVVVSNPCLYETRYRLAHEFIQRMSADPLVSLYIVELCYGDQLFQITEANHPNHLQIRAANVAPLWHKENMINLGIRHLLPPDWRSVAWIDADVEFLNRNWAYQTLQILNGTCDVVQLFHTCQDLGRGNQPILNHFKSAGYIYDKIRQTKKPVDEFAHPGFAWACNRLAYERLGGLFDKAILGSGDNIILYSLLGKVEKCMHPGFSPDYNAAMRQYETTAQGLRFGYVPGTIRHYFHGHKKNRKYIERWKVLMDHQYSPLRDIQYCQDGLIVPSQECPAALLDDILKYFYQRNEDE